MNDKYEFQVGDLVRLKSVEEILALGFWFNEQGGISYPNSRAVLLFTHELEHCGKEFVVNDFNLKGNIELKSTNSDVRIVNICPSVLEYVEVEDEFEDWISKPDLKVKPGDKVRIKTHEELIETGWTFDGDNYFHSIDDEAIVSGMHKFLGKVYTVKEVKDEVIKLEENEDYWNWTSYMIAEVVEEDTYEEVQEEDYKPYCAVVNYAPESNNTYEPTTWDKDRIQRGFENLEMYHKGYSDGFQRAMELMKKEFGVE